MKTSTVRQLQLPHAGGIKADYRPDPATSSTPIFSLFLPRRFSAKAVVKPLSYVGLLTNLLFALLSSTRAHLSPAEGGTKAKTPVTNLSVDAG